MHISPACSIILVLLAILASLPWGAMCEGAPSNLEDVVSAATTDHPAIVFAMAHQQALIQVPSPSSLFSPYALLLAYFLDGPLLLVTHFPSSLSPFYCNAVQH